MKKLDKNNLELIAEAPGIMIQEGLRSLNPGVIEKDFIVTEVIAAVANNLTATDYQPVFCGGTCLSKAYGALERMSEDVDFKIVFTGNTKPSKAQIKKDLSALKGKAMKALEDIGFSADDIDLRARDANQYIRIDAHFASEFERDTSLRSHVQLELNFTNMQRSFVRRPVTNMLAPWLSDEAVPAPARVNCVSLIEAASEKLIAFPRRVAHYKRLTEAGDNRNFDATLVRHIYDISRLLHGYPDLAGNIQRGMIKNLLSNLIIKDGLEFQNQHPQFVADAHGELKWALEQAESDSMREDYTRFLDDMVYAPDERRPSFEDAIRNFRSLLEPAIFGPSPDIQGMIDQHTQERKARDAEISAKIEAKAIKASGKKRAPKKTREEWESMMAVTFNRPKG